MTLREHLLVAAQLNPAALEDLLGPPLPPVAERAWGVFLDLNGTRGSSQGGLQPITYTELAHYQTLTGATLTPFECELVREADAVFVSEALARLRTSAET